MQFAVSPRHEGPTRPFWDGIRCAGSPLIRLEVAHLDASGAAASTGSIVTQGGVAPGQTRTYQVWFRNPLGPCGTGANASAGLQIAWQ